VKRPIAAYVLVVMVALLGFTVLSYRFGGSVEIVRRYGQTSKKKRPPILPKPQAKPPSQPTLKEDTKMVAQLPKKKEGKVASALPNKTQETLKRNTSSSRKDFRNSPFPRENPWQCDRVSEEQRHKAPGKKVKTTLDMHRVVAASTDKNPALVAKEVKRKTGISPWSPKKGKKTFLIIAYFVDKYGKEVKNWGSHQKFSSPGGI